MNLDLIFEFRRESSPMISWGLIKKDRKHCLGIQRDTLSFFINHPREINTGVPECGSKIIIGFDGKNQDGALSFFIKFS